MCSDLRESPMRTRDANERRSCFPQGRRLRARDGDELDAALDVDRVRPSSGSRRHQGPPCPRDSCRSIISMSRQANRGGSAKLRVTRTGSHLSQSALRRAAEAARASLRASRPLRDRLLLLLRGYVHVVTSVVSTSEDAANTHAPQTCAEALGAFADQFRALQSMLGDLAFQTR